jgi:Ion channel
MAGLDADLPRSEVVREEWAGKSPRERRRLVLRAITVPAITAVLFVTAYFLLPLEDPQGAATWLLLGAFLVIAAAVLSWQVWAVLKATHPALRALQALAVALPTYLLGFAVCYLWMAGSSPESFSEPVTRMGALYFTVTVFATVGFGDITATTDATRAVVTVQMLVNLALIAVGLRLLTAAVRHRLRRRDAADA